MYEFLEPSRAREIIRRIEVHYTPVHASWLNMAEIEIGAVMTQCLRRRIKSIKCLKEELAACVSTRNAAKKKVRWEFTCESAREKMEKHYPRVEEKYESLVFV